MSDPKTLGDWKRYIGALDGEALRLQAMAANSVDFVRQLQQEGLGAEDIHGILITFAQRMRQLGQMLPTDGYLDLSRAGLGL